MPTNYPNGLDTATELPSTRSDATATATAHAQDHNNLADAVRAVEAELGTNPKATYASVKARIDQIVADVSARATADTNLQSSIDALNAALGSNPQGVYATVKARLDQMQVDISNAGGGGGSSAPSIDVSGPPYNMSQTATGAFNKAAFLAAAAAADRAAAAAAGTRPELIAKAGIYPWDYAAHTPITTVPLTVPAKNGSVTFNVGSTVDYNVGDTLYLTDPGLVPYLATAATAKVQVTSKTASPATLTVTVTGGYTAGNPTTSYAGGVFPAGSVVSKQGVDEGRYVLKLVGSDYDINMPGVRLDVTNMVALNQGNKGTAYGPHAIQIGYNDEDQTNPTDFLTKAIYPQGQWVAVGSIYQPNNNFDGSYTGDLVIGGTTYTNRYAARDKVLLRADKPGDQDGSRLEPRGSRVQVVAATEFGSSITADITATTQVAANSTLTVPVGAPLNNRFFPDPNDSFTTTTGLTTGTPDFFNRQALQVADVSALTERVSRVFGSTDTITPEAGLLLIDDGTNQEIVLYEDVDFDNNILYLTRRAMLGTTSPTTFSGTINVRLIKLAKIDTELVAYSKVNGTASLSVRRRGLTATGTSGIVAHGNGAPMVTVPAPGEYAIGVPLQEDQAMLRQNPRVKTVLSVAMDGTYTQGTDQDTETISGNSFHLWPVFGTALVGSEKITWRYRDEYTLYGVTRGVQGTTVASHAAGTTIQVQPMGMKLTADQTLTSGATTPGRTFSVNGAEFLGTLGRSKYGRVDQEVLSIPSGASGLPATSTVTTAAVLLSDTSIAANTTGFVDPVAVGAGYAFATIDGEVFCYTGLTPTAFTGVQRGIATRALAHGIGAAITQRASVVVTSSGRGVGSQAATHTAGAVLHYVDATYSKKLITVRGVNVRGLEIWSAGTRAVAPRIVSSGGVGSGATGNHQSAIAICYADDVTIQGCRFKGTERDGVRVIVSQDVRIFDNQFEEINMQGSGNSVDMLGATSEVVVMGNTMRNCRHMAITSSAPDLDGSAKRIIIANNHAQDMVNAVFEMQGTTTDVTLIGNTIISAPGRCIVVNSQRTYIIANQVTSQATGYAVELNNFASMPGDFMVIGNWFNAVQNGIYVQMQEQGRWSVARGSAIISGNTFRNVVTQPITVVNSATFETGQYQQCLSITNNTVRGTRPPSGSPAEGVAAIFSIQQAHGVIVSGNQIWDVAGQQEAIYCANVLDVIISGNMIQMAPLGYSSPTPYTPRSAIRVASGDSVIIALNIAKGSSAALPIDATGATNVIIDKNLV